MCEVEMVYNPSYTGLRYDIIKEISGADNVVLDVGCATGSAGKFLLQNKIAQKVYGIEYSEDMSKEAAETYERVFNGDLNDEGFRLSIVKEIPECDYIIFGDVLEHLVEPETVLKELKDILKENGKIIISLPNVGHLETFIQLFIKGTWPRNNRGIFDKTHLRWYTRKDAIDLVLDSGLDVLAIRRNFRARDSLGSKFNWRYNLIKILNKDLVTFQYIIICKHAQ
ncbi:class I SAM-dependent methyltransferase [Salinimicrobium flavum]|uniref:Class I SAM-dependent methyltransferase n=1 Tax=Salinimicrobium flavum TaxID=1737065 RepID=A0ABW5IWU4_9FLAO